jgi:hypothetical protein
VAVARTRNLSASRLASTAAMLSARVAFIIAASP